MKDLDTIDQQGAGSNWWPWLIIVAAGIVLVVLFKTEGLVLAMIFVVAAFFISRYQPNSQEAEALRASIALSREDIEDILHEYDNFLNGTGVDAVADRTLHRPALADPGCSDPDISAFVFLAGTSRRFVSRVNARLKRNLSIQQLEALLSVTDSKASELHDAWIQARRSAHRLGGDY